MSGRRIGPEAGDALAEIRSALRLHYPSDDDVLPLGRFLEVEMVLAVLMRVDETYDARRAYLLLCNYALLRPETMGRDGHLLQMARRRLMGLASRGSWDRALRLYLDVRLEPLRLFDVGDDGVVSVRERPYGGIDRREAYVSHVLGWARAERTPVRAKSGGRYGYFRRCGRAGAPDSLAGRCEVTIPPWADGRTDAAEAPRRGAVGEIAVSLDDLVEEARRLSEATGREHFHRVLCGMRDQGLLRHVGEGGLEPSQGLAVREVTNLVGMVSSGKSVLMTVLASHLARAGRRVLLMQNSVAEVMGAVALLRSAGVDASPLVSRSRRVEHLDELFSRDGSMLLDETVARYLETPCLLDGLETESSEACQYDSTPCSRLLDDGGRSHQCPFWDICPSQAMSRDAMTSAVVVTTPAGLASMDAGEARTPFFLVVVKSFDLVVVDEADRVQEQLDEAFAPSVRFQALIRGAAQPTADAMGRNPELKMGDDNKEWYYDLLPQTELVAKSLLKSARVPEVRSWQTVQGGAFTSMLLLDELREEGLDARLADSLERHAKRYGEVPHAVEGLLLASCWGMEDRPYESALEHCLFVLGARLDPSMAARLKFLVQVMRFDDFVNDLADAYAWNYERDSAIGELGDYLRSGRLAQRAYLPSSLVGNLLGLVLTDDNDLVMFRQLAFGRALVGSLPWLETDVSGAPLGPAVLMMSGSSWIPGCLRYHLNRPVDYLLGAEPWKAKKLEDSLVADLGISHRVSGARGERRTEALRAVVEGSASALIGELSERPGKALVIVNSYEEGRETRDALERLLRSEGRPELACALTREPQADGDRFVPRSEVGEFWRHPARILVAPAKAIERGHNILDDKGNAAFTSLFFCVRPMDVPRDVVARLCRMNGIVETRRDSLPAPAGELSVEVRALAWKVWMGLGRAELTPLGSLRRSSGGEAAEALLTDVVAGLLCCVVQVFGRLARLADPDRPAPRVYFADAAFRGGEQGGSSFRTLEELDAYLRRIGEEGPQPEVAEALYGPFMRAFERGLR